MKLSLVEHGGWGTLLKRRPIAIDTDALPPAAADELCTLAAAAERAGGSDPGDPRPTSAAPEAMRYEIILEREGHAVTVKGSDTSAAPEFIALQRAIRKYASVS